MRSSITLLSYALLATTLDATATAQTVPDGAPPASSGRVVRLAKEIEPSLKGDASRVAQYIDFYRSRLANDSRVCAFEVTGEIQDEGSLVLDGFVEFAESREGLQSFLETLGFGEIDNRVEVLPSENLASKHYGLVKIASTISYDSPERNQSAGTTCLLGEPLYLLRIVGDYYLAHSVEGYLGYIPKTAVTQLTQAQFESYVQAPGVILTSNYTVDAGLELSAGTRLKRTGETNEGVECELPDGKTVTLPKNICKTDEPPREEIDRAIENGEKLLGVKYYWGGKTAAGIDCSGLVQICYATIGINLPRDSNQQCYVGRLVATRWHRSRLQRGDLLYFLGPLGRIRHTAIYLGDDQFLQAEVPIVTISSFNPEDDNYAPVRDKNFAFAKRLW
ncbi:MAG: C40 family peptidase [Lacipirellulaceae bacterium]